MTPAIVRLSASTLTALVACLGVARPAEAQAAKAASARHADDGVYDRFDGDLDLGLGLGAEFGSAGRATPALRGTAHYFSIAGIYLSGRVQAGGEAAPSLFSTGVELRPLFVPRWAKGFETGPGLFDLTLDSLCLSLGAFWAERAALAAAGSRGFEAGFGFGVPLLTTAAGPWLEARGLLRYPDGGGRQEAVLVSFAWHGFVTTPFSAESGL